MPLKPSFLYFLSQNPKTMDICNFNVGKLTLYPCTKVPAEEFSRSLGDKATTAWWHRSRWPEEARRFELIGHPMGTAGARNNCPQWNINDTKIVERARGMGLHGRTVAPCHVCAYMRACAAPSTGYLVRETYAHVIACPSWNYSSPRPTADPRHRRSDRPATTGASPSGMIMHRSASHYTYT